MMNDRGKIMAVGLTDKRVERLKENLDRLCVTNAEVRKWDWRQKDSHWKAFDRILVDVPCSNTGVINRRVDVRWRLQTGTSKSMSAEQRRLLSKMIPFLNDGGSVVYSTCSIDREENEVVVRDVLRQFPEMTLVESIQLFPERSDHDGAYAALLKKRR